MRKLEAFSKTRDDVVLKILRRRIKPYVDLDGSDPEDLHIG